MQQQHFRNWRTWASPPPVEAANAQVRAVFEKLDELDKRRQEFARHKWDAMSALEKAKLVNLRWSQKPPKGFDWEPTEKEAEAFLEEVEESIASHGLSWALSKDERVRFDEEHDELISELAALSGDAIPDLLAKIRDAERSGPDAAWAYEALGEMGAPAIEAVTGEIDKLLATPAEASDYGRRLGLLARALARTRDPATVDTLVKILDTDEEVRERAAWLLGEIGDEKAIAVFERDIPTAYADAAYQAAHAIWQINKRLGKEAGPEPERPLNPNQSKLPNWQGMEKSIRSPNPGIRITALRHLDWLERSEKSTELLMDVTDNDEDPEVRAAAGDALVVLFFDWCQATAEADGDLAPHSVIFGKLVDRAREGDERFTIELLRHAYDFDQFKHTPHYETARRLAVDLALSDDTRLTAAGLSALARRPDWLEAPLEPPVRDAMTRRIVEGLDSDYGRLRVDAITCAGALKLKEAVPKLIEIIESQAFHHRDHATRTLQIIGDPRALPVLQKMSQIDPYVDQYGLYANRESAWQAIHATMTLSAE